MNKDQLILGTILHSLFPATTLQKALQNLTFIQIDPIKSPAPAQDLILRHRVKDYHVGDIDKQYIDLNLEEDFLYAHWYMIPAIWQLLHPREKFELTDYDKHVYDTLKNLDEINPRDLEKYFEKKREINWWGGYSRSSKMALDRLHYYGLLRIVRREKGLRIYRALPTSKINMPIEERLSKIVMAMVHIMAPVAAITLSQSSHRIHRHYGPTRSVIKKLVEEGRLEQQVVDGITYLWPHGWQPALEVPQTVKFLAPFDPVVRDRIRFEHLWGWLYQFEAYVPAAKRIRGYYAMPILWGSEMVGWANVKRTNSNVDVELGFVNGRPRSTQFAKELELEIERMKRFLS